MEKRNKMIAAKVSQTIFDKINEAKRITGLSVRQLIEFGLYEYFSNEPKLKHLIKPNCLLND